MRDLVDGTAVAVLLGWPDRLQLFAGLSALASAKNVRISARSDRAKLSPLTLIGEGMGSVLPARRVRASHVLMPVRLGLSASRRNRLPLDPPRAKGLPIAEKFANARGPRQHA